jgi:hypothetical protein
LLSLLPRAVWDPAAWRAAFVAPPLWLPANLQSGGGAKRARAAKALGRTLDEVVERVFPSLALALPLPSAFPVHVIQVFSGEGGGGAEAAVMAEVAGAWAHARLGAGTGSVASAHTVRPVRQAAAPVLLPTAAGGAQAAAAVAARRRTSRVPSGAAQTQPAPASGASDDDGDSDDGAAALAAARQPAAAPRPPPSGLVLFNLERSLDAGNLAALRHRVEELPRGRELLLLGRVKIQPSLSRSNRCVFAISQRLRKNGFEGCRVLHLASDKQHERMLCMCVSSRESTHTHT